MRIDDLTVEVRNASFGRVGKLLPQDLVGFTAVLRFNNVGNWSIPLPAGHNMAEQLRLPNAGIIVTGPSGVLFSGYTTKAVRTQTSDNPEGTWEISGVTDDVVLGERLAYPTPTTADVAAQSSAYDTRTGKASTVMYGYVTANIGSSAPAARKISNLTTAADGALGSTVTGNARFDVLGKLLTQLAAVDGLGFDLKQSGGNLVFRVFAPTDRSSYIRMDVDNNMLTKAEYAYTSPEATRAIVAGQGEGADRTFVEVTTTASTTAESTWGRRIEVFKDSRSTNDSTELAQAGVEELSDKGKTIEAISVTPTDDSTMAFGVDWYLGDKVAVVVGDTTIAQIVTEVGIAIDPDGVRIGATVGEPAAADPDSSAATAQASQDNRISNLERNDTGSGGGGATVALPTGSILQWATATAPTDYLLCDGSTVSRTTYANLFAVIGTQYGSGDGSTTFKLPDLRGRVPVGSNSGTFSSLGAAGGAETVTLTSAQIPSHGHSFSATTSSSAHTHTFSGTTSTDSHNHTVPNRTIVPGSTSGNFFESWSSGGSTSRTHTTSTDTHSHTYSGTTSSDAHTHTVSGTTGTAGSGEAHSNLQPYLVINFIIKT